jgi:hypothetical protein
MYTYKCNCGGRLFFNNSVCTGCGHEVAWCEACRTVVPLERQNEGYRCGNSKCAQTVAKCSNFVNHGVCNRVLVVEGDDAAGLCKACRLNRVIPDLSVDGNRQRWADLETAKRRLLYQLDELGLKYAAEDLPEGAKSLMFSFQATTPESTIFTGHWDGLITINIAEADSVERERVRTMMHEPHRTLLGHMRHETGHFYWMMLVENAREEEFSTLFGDYRNPPYAEALERYYQYGPASGWATQYVSAYASSHPWEDFAETWGLYLDLWAVVTTTRHHLPSLLAHPNELPIDVVVKCYQQLGVFFNEINRTMGLTDLVPEVIVPPVVKKIDFIHRIVGSPALEDSNVKTSAAN